MAKICPQTGEKVLYLDCLECEDRKDCDKGLNRKDKNDMIDKNLKIRK